MIMVNLTGRGDSFRYAPDTPRQNNNFQGEQAPSGAT